MFKGECSSVAARMEDGERRISMQVSGMVAGK